MKRASIRDLHIRTSELVREAASGTVITIERRGEPVAELRPISATAPKRLPRLDHIWNTFPQVKGDSTSYIKEDRDR